jgi:hypothetical protein
MCIDKLTKTKNSMMLLFLSGSVTVIILVVTLTHAFALTQSELSAKINSEANWINGIMKDKIANYPGLDLGGSCYSSTTAYDSCISDLTNQMQPYYDQAGKEVSDYMDSHIDSFSDYPYSSSYPSLDSLPSTDSYSSYDSLPSTDYDSSLP